MKNKVVIYTTSWCGDCQRAEKILSEIGVTYAKIDIEKDNGAAQKVMSLANGKRVVPTLIVSDKNGEDTIMINPSPMELMNLR